MDGEWEAEKMVVLVWESWFGGGKGVGCGVSIYF